MSGKFQRITQQEAGPLTATGAKTFTHTFDGSAGGIDWSKSYMEIEMDVQAGNLPYVVSPVALQDIATGINYSPAAFIQNVRLSHDKSGVLEENRNVNVHNQTELYVKKSNAELVAKAAEGYGLVPVSGSGRAQMIVPMSDLLGMGKQPGVFPLDQRGGVCTLQCELESQINPLCSQAPVVGSIAGAAGPPAIAAIEITAADIAAAAAGTTVTTFTTVQVFSTLAARNLYLSVGRNVIINYTFDGAACSVPAVISAVAGAAAAAAAITLDRAWATHDGASDITGISMQLQDVGSIYCGLTGATGGNTAATPNVTAVDQLARNFVLGGTYTSIAYSAPTGGGAVRIYTASAALNTATQNGDDVDLVFAGNIVPAIPQTAADNNTPVYIYLNQQPLTASITQVNLNIYRAAGSKDPFEYSTLSLEKAIIPAGTDYRNQFILEKNLTGLKVMMPEQTKLVSAWDGTTLGQYRVAINNRDTSNRDIIVDPEQNFQAYLDRLKLFYGSDLHNLDRYLSTPTLAADYYHFMIAETVETQGNDMADIRVISPAATPVLNLFLFKDKLMVI